MSVKLSLERARELFNRIKSGCKIYVRPHAWTDHPKRLFTPAELDELVRRAKWLHINDSPEAIDGSFKVIVNDSADRRCDIIIVCSAYREIR